MPAYRITKEMVIAAVAAVFNLQPLQLKERCNAQRAVYPRQISMYLIRQLTKASLPEIGVVFGGKTIQRFYIR